MPASLRLLRGYSAATFGNDLVAGVTVGLVALSLAMAFAIASGLTPQAGIYCAIVTGFLISALGGSRFQIGGPTGAFVVVVAGIIAQYGVDGLFMCTMMRTLVLCGAREQPAAVMRQAGFYEHIGEQNICPHIEAALTRAQEIQAARAA
jgi:SulP family sulfate permease